MVAKIIQTKWMQELTRKLSAALASLTYYNDRSASNPAVKEAWTEEGLKRVADLNLEQFLDYPTRGPVWKKKLETVQRLIHDVRVKDVASLRDDEFLCFLKSIPGVGDQTARMVALFWFNRAVPIIDGYLCQLLHQHGLVRESFKLTSGNTRPLDTLLREGARELARDRPEWTATGVLSSLYLWVCEVGRFHCQCESGEDTRCPIARNVSRIRIE